VACKIAKNGLGKCMLVTDGRCDVQWIVLAEEWNIIGKFNLCFNVKPHCFITRDIVPFRIFDEKIYIQS
jgi:hypothetical protein